MLGQEEASDGGEGSKPAIIAVTTLFWNFQKLLRDINESGLENKKLPRKLFPVFSKHTGLWHWDLSTWNLWLWQQRTVLPITVTVAALDGQLGVFQITTQNISYTIVYSRLSAPPASKKGLSLFYRYKNCGSGKLRHLLKERLLCDASEFPTIYV